MTTKMEIPEELVPFLEARVHSGEATSIESYVVDVLRHMRERYEAEDKLEAFLLEGLNSGPGEVATDEWWNELTERFRSRHKQPPEARAE